MNTDELITAGSAETAGVKGKIMIFIDTKTGYQVKLDFTGDLCMLDDQGRILCRAEPVLPDDAELSDMLQEAYEKLETYLTKAGVDKIIVQQIDDLRFLDVLINWEDKDHWPNGAAGYYRELDRTAKAIASANEWIDRNVPMIDAK